MGSTFGQLEESSNETRSVPMRSRKQRLATRSERIPKKQRIPKANELETFEEVRKSREAFPLGQCKLSSPIKEIPGYKEGSGGRCRDMYLQGFGSEIQKEITKLVLCPPGVRNSRKDRCKIYEKMKAGHKMFWFKLFLEDLEEMKYEAIKNTIGDCPARGEYWPPETPGFPYIKVLIYHWIFLQHTYYVLTIKGLHVICKSSPIVIPVWLHKLAEECPKESKTVLDIRGLRMEWVVTYLGEIQVEQPGDYTCIRKCTKRKGKRKGFKKPKSFVCCTPKCVTWQSGRILESSSSDEDVDRELEEIVGIDPTRLTYSGWRM